MRRILPCQRIARLQYGRTRAPVPHVGGRQYRARHAGRPYGGRCAVCGRTSPDWATKVEWLLSDCAYACGGRRASVCPLELVLACPDHAPARLQHLKHLGVASHLAATSSSAFTSSAPSYHHHHRHTSPHSQPAVPALTQASLTFLLDMELEEAACAGATAGATASPGGRRHCLSRALAPLAAVLGHLAVLQQLHARGHPIPASTLHVAASAGQCEVVRWLLQVLSGARLGGGTAVGTASCGGDCTGKEDPAPASATETAAVAAAEAGAAPLAAAAMPWQVRGHPYQRLQLQRLLTSSLLHSALASGSVRLLAALQGLGCPWDAFTASVAVGVGSQEQLEWLAGNGCPMGDNGLPYTMACEYGDIAMLRCLRRVGCAWGPRCSAFVHEACPSRLPVLRALLQLGCPVQWEAALAAARGRVGRGGEMLVGWLTEERARREAAERGQQQQELQGMM